MVELEKISLIDFCTIYPGESATDAYARSVELAQRAEELGIARIWYAEHHNMPSISSSAPAVLIAHVGAQTKRIRLGAGGVMLPNHAPLVVAEQFGALAHMYPGRIDLGLGRAPGTDPVTVRALRRRPDAADTFPNDLLELDGFLAGNSRVPGVQAVPNALVADGAGEVSRQVPLYILGSSLYGAQLAAQLGLPYAFASHFAPTYLHQAIETYRREFQPSEALAEPYVIAAVNVCAADTQETAEENFRQVLRARLRSKAKNAQRIRGIGAASESIELDDAQLDVLMSSPFGQQITGMLHYTAVGTKEQVADYLRDFQQQAQANELMISLQTRRFADSLHSLELMAEGMGLSAD